MTQTGALLNPAGEAAAFRTGLRTPAGRDYVRGPLASLSSRWILPTLLPGRGPHSQKQTLTPPPPCPAGGRVSGHSVSLPDRPTRPSVPEAFPHGRSRRAWGTCHGSPVRPLTGRWVQAKGACDPGRHSGAKELLRHTHAAPGPGRASSSSALTRTGLETLRSRSVPLQSRTRKVQVNALLKHQPRAQRD